ncbi:unnamed protein product [Orchesella dallaii]|uniref:Uncharacterized protein n=1 Tax=Orchesella dallaii TaxID=48710 RepID=A0ABP1QQY4_9HEXA
MVKGPVAIVTFSTVYSGLGFRLHFRMTTQMSEEPAFGYQLFHQNLQMQNKFAYNAKSNQVAIVAISSGINLSNRIQVDVTTSFVSQFNKSCYSDSLLIYDVSGRIGKRRAVLLNKAFTSADVDFEVNQTERRKHPHSCVSLTETRLLACQNNEQCRNVSISSSFQTGSSFLAIFSGVNVTDNLKYNRGFALTSRIK